MSYEKNIKYIAKVISRLFESSAGTSLFSDMTTNYSIPKTSAVASFCKDLEEVMRSKGYDIEQLGGGTFVAEAVDAVRGLPNTIARMTEYEIISLDTGDMLMSDDEEGAVKLLDGNFLIFHFEDAMVSYRKFGSSDGGL
jgi:hypothetical protein